jgi:hypothetical protein
MTKPLPRVGGVLLRVASLVVVVSGVLALALEVAKRPLARATTTPAAAELVATTVTTESLAEYNTNGIHGAIGAGAVRDGHGGGVRWSPGRGPRALGLLLRPVLRHHSHGRALQQQQVVNGESDASGTPAATPTPSIAPCTVERLTGLVAKCAPRDTNGRGDPGEDPAVGCCAELRALDAALCFCKEPFLSLPRRQQSSLVPALVTAPARCGGGFTSKDTTMRCQRRGVHVERHNDVRSVSPAFCLNPQYPFRLNLTLHRGVNTRVGVRCEPLILEDGDGNGTDEGGEIRDESAPTSAPTASPTAAPAETQPRLTPPSPLSPLQPQPQKPRPTAPQRQSNATTPSPRPLPGSPLSAPPPSAAATTSLEPDLGEVCSTAALVQLVQDGCAGALSGTDEGEMEDVDEDADNTTMPRGENAESREASQVFAGSTATREACCEDISRLNDAECFCRDDVVAVLRTFPANFRTMFTTAPDTCG